VRALQHTTEWEPAAGQFLRYLETAKGNSETHVRCQELDTDAYFCTFSGRQIHGQIKV